MANARGKERLRQAALGGDAEEDGEFAVRFDLDELGFLPERFAAPLRGVDAERGLDAIARAVGGYARVAHQPGHNGLRQEGGGGSGLRLSLGLGNAAGNPGAGKGRESDCRHGPDPPRLFFTSGTS